jgi:hypothetical protein
MSGYILLSPLKSKWFKPQMAWNRLITTRTTHTNLLILVWIPKGLQRARKPQN